jgi:cobalt transporter subunit CbtB
VVPLEAPLAAPVVALPLGIFVLFGVGFTPVSAAVHNAAYDSRHNSESRIIPSPAAVVGKNPFNFND